MNKGESCWVAVTDLKENNQPMQSINIAQIGFKNKRF